MFCSASINVPAQSVGISWCTNHYISVVTRLFLFFELTVNFGILILEDA